MLAKISFCGLHSLCMRSNSSLRNIYGWAWLRSGHSKLYSSLSIFLNWTNLWEKCFHRLMDLPRESIYKHFAYYLHLSLKLYKNLHLHWTWMKQKVPFESKRRMCCFKNLLRCCFKEGKHTKHWGVGHCWLAFSYLKVL